MNIDFKRNVLEKSRKAMSSCQELDDETAREIIIKTVFGFSQVKAFSDDEINRVIDEVFYKTRRRLGILQPLLDNPDISEIMVNGPENIFYESGGRIYRYEVTFQSVSELEEIMRNVASDVHREINEMSPIVDARLADGSRVNCVFRNIAVNGPSMTIRKFSDSFMRIQDLVANGTMDEETAELLMILVKSGYNIFVSGGTSSGKTTLLNALSEAIPENERVIVIEDSMELKMGFIENIVRLETRNSNTSGNGEIPMSDLVKTSLRMRPDRIVVGEVRKNEVVDMIQAMNTGHDGSLSTGHGNSIRGMLKRLESMYLMAMPISVDAIRAQISEGIDIMIHIEKDSAGRRRITEIAEILPYDRNDFNLNMLMESDSEGRLNKTGNRLFNKRKVLQKSRENAGKLQKKGFI